MNNRVKRNLLIYELGPIIFNNQLNGTLTQQSSDYIVFYRNIYNCAFIGNKHPLLRRTMEVNT